MPKAATIRIPSREDVKHLLFMAVLKFRLHCRVGKHMPTKKLEQRVAVLPERNELAFQMESAQLVTYCVSCGKVFETVTAKGFSATVWSDKAPRSYPLDPARPIGE